MKLNLTKEEAYEIANEYIEKYQLRKNKCNDIEKCVTFYKKFKRIDGCVWVVAALERALDEFHTEITSKFRTTYIISDRTKQVEQVIGGGGDYLTHHINDNMELNLTKEKAFKIVNDYIINYYDETYEYEYIPVDDLNEHVAFYNVFDTINGAAWLVMREIRLSWGEIVEMTYVVSDKESKLVHILGDYGEIIDIDADKEPIPLLERLKVAFDAGTKDEQIDVVEDLQWTFIASHDDDKNVEDFDAIMDILIAYVIENKESEIVENVLCAIIDAQEFQDAKHIDFGVFAENLYMVSGENTLLYIDILRNTKDSNYTPYLLSLKNHVDGKVRLHVENALIFFW